MPSNVWLQLLAAAGTIAQIAALITVLRSGVAKRWRSLCATLAVSAIISVFLACLRINHATYVRFYPVYYSLYWGSAAFQSLLRIWLIGDVARSFEGMDFLPKPFSGFIGTFAAVMGITAGSYAYHASPHLDSVLSGIVLLDRAVTFAWFAFTVFLLAVTLLLNFEWAKLSARVATATILQIIAESVSSQLRAFNHHLYVYAFLLNTTVQIGTFIYLIASFRHPTYARISRREILPNLRTASEKG